MCLEALRGEHSLKVARSAKTPPKGRIHVIAPFIGTKNGTLTARQQWYNNVHEWYRACSEHLFGQLWHWGLVRNIWHGVPNELHQSVPVLLHFTQFCIRRQVRHPPYGPQTMSRLIFGLIIATQPPSKLRERMRQMYVCYIVRSAPPSQFVVTPRALL